MDEAAGTKLIQNPFPAMPEGGVAKIVAERYRLGKVFIKTKSLCYGARIL